MNESYYNLLGLIVSVVAIIISAISLIRTRKTQKAFLDFERIHAELSSKQLQEMNSVAMARTKANICIEIVEGSVFLINRSCSVARNININFEKNEDNCIFTSELEMLPFPHLNPSQELKLIGSYNTKEAPRVFSIEVTWLNEDDSNGIYTGMIQN